MTWDPDELPMCVACDSEILRHDDAVMRDDGAIHLDCVVHLVAGGVNHQRRLCGCFGGDQPADPPSLTRRQAARVAAMHYRRAQPLTRIDGPPPTPAAPD